MEPLWWLLIAALFGVAIGFGIAEWPGKHWFKAPSLPRWKRCVVRAKQSMRFHARKHRPKRSVGSVCVCRKEFGMVIGLNFITTNERKEL